MPDSSATTETAHAQGLARFRFIAETDRPQRESEQEALGFEAGDQWPADAKVSRQGSAGNETQGIPAVPSRPMLTMRTLDQPLAQITSMARAADLGIKIIPKDGEANEATAKVIAGLIRSIEADSHAEEAYYWGFQRMRSCGRGYWRVNKTYASDEGGFDQVLRIEPIENGASVYLDPLPFWHAAGGFWEPEFGFITQDISEEDYKREYGATALANASTSDMLSALGDDQKYWVIDNAEGGRYFRIAEYFRAVYDTATETDDENKASREIRTRRIVWAKMNGVEFIHAEQEWDGQFIPIIPCTGNKYNISGKTVYEGMVQPNISACRMLNYMVSAAAEKIGLASMAPWIGIAGQFQGFDKWWDQANTRNFSKLEYNAMTAKTGSQLLPPPTRNNDEPAIQAFTHMIGLFTNFIRSTTGVPDAALGHVNPNDKSGKAIQSLQRAAEQGASNWLGYLAAAIRHTGCVLADLAPHVYDRPGRVERILGIDRTPETVMLNAPYTRGQDGQPVEHKPSMFGRMGQAIGGALGRPSPSLEQHMLDKGHYGVVVDVGKSHDTLKQENLTSLGILMDAAPQIVPTIADLLVKAMPMDPTLAEQVAERLKPPSPEGMENLPPEAKAIIEQLQQQLAEATEAANDNQTKVTIAAQSDATKLKVAEMQAQTALIIEEMKQGMAKLAEDMKLTVASLKVTTDAETADEDRAAEVAEGQRDRAHELGMAQVNQSQESRESDKDRQESDKDRQLSVQESDKDRKVTLDTAKKKGVK